MDYTLEKIEEYKNFIYVIIFKKEGYRCGYIKIPEEIEKDITISNLISFQVHGGIDYIKTSKEYPVATKEFVKWIGFACNKEKDGRDLLKSFNCKLINEYQYELLSFLQKDDSNLIRSLQYVEDECKKLIDQLNLFLGTINKEGK